MKTSERVFNFIIEYMTEHQYSPTIREIGEGCGISSTGVVDYNLRLLERRGQIKRTFGEARTIRVRGARWVYVPPKEIVV